MAALLSIKNLAMPGFFGFIYLEKLILLNQKNNKTSQHNKIFFSKHKKNKSQSEYS